MSINFSKTPWPWFGGKADAAEHVWAALGDCDHYVEPFAGSLAVLLRRPHVANRPYHSETVNDLDGLLCNAWRSIAMSPDLVAEAASWPVCEADLHARHLALLRWRSERQLEHLMADPLWHDPGMAGWWIWGQSAWIGGGWCSGRGPWHVGDDGRITKRGRESREEGVWRMKPHLSNDGRGVQRASLREEGVQRKLPDLSNDGRGAQHASLREEGVAHEREYHAMTMPQLKTWMRFLSARLRHVRILQGCWTRATTTGALKALSVRQGGHCGVFLDPPYSDVRAPDLYAHDSLTVTHDVRRWCIEHEDDHDLRIVLAGFDSEHEELEARGWRVVEWYREGFLKGGMGNIGGKSQQKRERLWLSLSCLSPTETSAQLDLWR